MQFNFIWDANVDNAPAAFKAAVIAAGQQLASYFSNDVTLNIQVGWGENRGIAVTGTAWATGGIAFAGLPSSSLTFAQAYADLARVASTADNAAELAWLQSQGDPTHGGRFVIGGAQQKVFGLVSPTSSQIDGAIGFSTTLNFDYNSSSGTVAAGKGDFNAAAMHEITQAMGRVPGLGQLGGNGYAIQDLFRFSSLATPQLAGGQPAFFSPDGGITVLNPYDTTADFGDWATSIRNDAFSLAWGGFGVPGFVTATDVRQMNALGFALSDAGAALSRSIKTTTAGATVAGTSSDDVIYAAGGSNTVLGGAGNDMIAGSTGTNISVYGSDSKNYVEVFTKGIPAFTVQDRTGKDGSDSLTNVQQLQFTDRTLDTSWFSKTAALSLSEITGLAQIYIASFNRAPDALGLDYWGSRLKDGMALQDIARSFFTQPEATAAYPAGQPTQDFITKVYNNVLGRAPDAAGLTYWSGQLGSGGVGKDSFLLAIINGAIGPDSQTLTNKAAVGLHFALAQGLSDSAWAKTVMSGVTASTASVSAANTQTDAFAATAATAAGTEFVVKILGIVA